MLIEKSRFQLGDVVNLKLVSGDEIVGELTNTESGNYELRRPCLVVTTNEGIALIQSMFGLDPDKENLVYRDQHIITVCHTHDKMREHYETITKE